MQTTPIPGIKVPKAFVLYVNSVYIPTATACIRSLNIFSEIPVIVYVINSDEQIPGATCINWKCNVTEITHQNDYIDRKDPAIFEMLIQRPDIVRDALQNYANQICYVDADSVATQYVNNIFDYFYEEYMFPMFMEGIYDYMMIDGRGAVINKEDLSNSLEAPLCELFGIDQYVRKKYIQTGYFVAGQNCIPFLSEWYQWCSVLLPPVNHNLYAPFHEETIANVLLWKYNMQDSLPYMYCNGKLDRLTKIVNNEYQWGKNHEQWFKLPIDKEHLLFIHGEKDPIKMNQMIELLSKKKQLLLHKILWQ